MEEVEGSEVVSRYLRRDAVVEIFRCGAEPKSAGIKPALQTILGGTAARWTVAETSCVGDAGMKWIFLCVTMMVWPMMQQEAAKQTEEKPVAVEASKASADTPRLVNPVKPTAASLAGGKKTYGTDCAMCHGKTGAGDGDLAADMKLTLKDYRDPASLKGMSDGEIFTVIEKGKGQMSGEEGRMKPTQIWDVVNYVRSLAKK